MSDFLEQLFRTTKIKEFVPLFKEAEEKYGSQEEFLRTLLPICLCVCTNTTTTTPCPTASSV